MYPADDQPEIPPERPDERRPLPPEEIQRLFDGLEISSNAFARAWGLDRHGIRRHLYEPGRPPWFGNVMVILHALIDAKHVLEQIPKEIRPPYVSVAILNAENTLQRFAGSRFPLRAKHIVAGHAAPAFVCPACNRPSWNLNDAKNGWCAACHEFTGETQPRS